MNLEKLSQKEPFHTARCLGQLGVMFVQEKIAERLQAIDPAEVDFDGQT